MIWLAILACMVISFTFSGIESGVLSVNRVRLRHFAKRGEEAAVKLDLLLVRIERLMITVLLITNAANVIAVVLLYIQLDAWFGGWGAILTVLVSLPVAVLVLEFLPRAVFQRFPYRTLAVVARILTVAHWIFGPLVKLGVWLSRPAFRASREAGQDVIAGVEDIRRVINERVERGLMRPVQRSLIDNVLDFREIRAKDVMQRLEDVPTVNPEAWVRDIVATARQSGFDHFPVIGRDGSAEGLIRVFDVLIEGAKSGRAQSYMRRVVSVQADELASEVLRKLRAARMNLAIVMDDERRAVGVLFKDRLIHRMLNGA